MTKSLHKVLSISLSALLLAGCSSTNTTDSSTSEPTGKEFDSAGNEVSSDSSDSTSTDSKEKDATVVESDSDEKTTISAEAPSKDNIEVSDVYPGMATGKNGDLYVMVSYANGTITDVEVSNHSEDDSRSEVSEALTKVPEEIVEANSTNVDVVSGATETSNAIMEAVAAAIARAE